MCKGFAQKRSFSRGQIVARGSTTLSTMSWWEWVVRVSGKSVPTQIAQEVGINQSAINRWKHGGVPSADSVKVFAGHYGRPVLEAFVAAGIISAQEAGTLPTPLPDPTELDDKVLVKEIERRLSDAKKMRGAADGSTAGPGSAAEPLAEGPRGRLKRQQQEVKTKAQKRAESPKV